MFERTDDFKEIIEFGQLSDRLYDLKMNKLQGDFKPGLATFISEHSIRAILIGTRRWTAFCLNPAASIRPNRILKSSVSIVIKQCLIHQSICNHCLLHPCLPGQCYMFSNVAHVVWEHATKAASCPTKAGLLSKEDINDNDIVIQMWWT